MDRRSWPWKKKSSNKAAINDRENSKNLVNYVQLSQERYAHLSETEDRVKVLNEKLNDALSEITTKENLVKQHTKVAEEAISGWEKAEAEALSLKTELESMKLLKLTAEDKAANLDGALKECMKQVRSVKEEGEQKLNDIVFEKTRQWEKARNELEMKIEVFDQELQKSSVENDALSRSLEEHSEMLVKISEEKCHADAEIDVLKVDIRSYEKEINSLKYEIHVVSKELEIRNEEKNMCARSAEVANKQHLEDIKKITKLEAECQKLRGLVRKKLPGPAALAQMKQEVEKLGQDYGEEKLRRSPAKCFSPRSGSSPDLVFDRLQQLHKENECLTTRLVAMEEVTKMLKEALSDRNTAIQVSQDHFARTPSKVQSVGRQISVTNGPTHSSNSSIGVSAEGFLHRLEGKSQKSISMSDCGFDEEGSCSESCGATSSIECWNTRKENGAQNVIKSNKLDQLELMDDFLEMEKLACLPAQGNRNNFAMDNLVGCSAVGNSGGIQLVDGLAEVKSQKAHQPYLSPTRSPATSAMQEFAEKTSAQNETLLLKLRSEISLAFESQRVDANIAKLLMDIKNILQKVQKDLPQHSGCNFEDVQLDGTSCNEIRCHENNSSSKSRSFIMKSENLGKAILQIHDFVLSLGKEAIEAQGIPSNVNGHCQKAGDLSSAIDKLSSTELSVDDFLEALSSVLLKTKELCYGIFREKEIEGEGNNSDCIDKVTLLEKKVVQNGHTKGRSTDSSSDSEILHEGRSYPSSEKMDKRERSLKNLEQVKLENERLMAEIARLNENLEQKRQDLLKAEEQVASLESQLATSQKSNGLADTQLKCMTESYNSLESRCRHLEGEIEKLEEKVAILDDELKQERRTHVEDLAKYKDLQEQMEREERNFSHPEDEIDVKIKQEREITAAAEKLAECQETILLLGRQLKAMNPQADFRASSANKDCCVGDGFLKSMQNTTVPPNMEANPKPQAQNLASILQKTGSESPFDAYSCQFSKSDTCTSSMTTSSSVVGSKRSKHRSTWSYSSNTSSASTEKYASGFSRFFSKGKGEH